MKNYYKILREAEAECAACGIWLGEVVDIGICYKTLKRWGRCRYIADEDRYYIEISYRLVDDAASDKALKETILHELCHTVDGCMNHQKKWKETVAKLNERYGYNIKTADTAADKGLESIEPEKVVKYEFKCGGCGQIVQRSRASKFTKYYRVYTCRICGGKFIQVV